MLFLPLVVGILFYFSSCTKDMIVDDQNLNNLGENAERRAENAASETPGFPDPVPVSNCDDNLSAVTIRDGRLVFKTEEHFSNVVRCLETAVDEHNDKFDAQYQKNTADEADSIATVLGFIGDQPLIDFENKFAGFESIRKQVESEIVIFLDQDADAIDWSLNPDDKYLGSEEFHTLLNLKCEVIINGKIRNLCEEENLLNPNFGDRAGTRNGVCFLSDCCGWGISIRSDQYRNGARKAKLKVWLVNNFSHTWTRFGGKVVNYKRRSNNKWRRTRERVILDIGGIGRIVFQCDGDPRLLGKRKSKRRKSFRLVKHYFSPGRGIVALDDELYSAININNGEASFLLPLDL